MVALAEPMAIAPPGKPEPMVTSPRRRVRVSSPSFTLSSRVVITTVCSVWEAVKVTLPLGVV